MQASMNIHLSLISACSALPSDFNLHMLVCLDSKNLETKSASLKLHKLCADLIFTYDFLSIIACVHLVL